MRASNIPGLSLALTDRDSLRGVATRGFADLARRKRVRPETLFEIGSISKSFTSIALLQQWEAGRLDLHAPVTRYLPWFAVRSKYEPITVHHLMTHTAGIIMGTDFSTEARYETWALRDTETGFPPGSRFHYSNVGYKVLGLVLESLTGEPASETVRTRILEPLGMDSTLPAITHEARSRLAVGYSEVYDDRPSHPSHALVPATWLETDTADGNIASPAPDMATFLRMLLNRGRGPQGRILSEEGFSLLTQRAVRPDDAAHGEFYGYALNVKERGGHTTIGHSGSMVGYAATILADLDAGLGVVVLANAMQETGEIADAAMQLLRAASEGRRLPSLPRPKDPRYVRKPSDYTGAYRDGLEEITIEADRGRLVLRRGADRALLEARETDAFFVDHPELVRFLLRFRREGDRVVEALHGSHRYAREGATIPAAPTTPPEWEAYAGHYRSHNPWLTNFRVVMRRGALLLIRPGGEEDPLAPVSDGVFRVGATEHSPERIRFDTILDGKAIRANLSGCDYYRTFAP